MSTEGAQNTLPQTQALSFLENTPDCAVMLNRQWAVVYANPAFRERFLQGEAGQAGDFLSLLDSASVARIQELQAQLLKNPRQMELSHLGPDASVAPLHYSFFPVSGPDGKEILLAGIGRDRTADLALLGEIIQLNIELEKKQKELSEANARLEQLAITDQMTRLYNRHYFFQVAHHFWEEARRYRLSLITMMMDVDNFKSINDQYGHLFGDHVLREAAVRLRNNTRKSDILARYGGEEIALLASNTDLKTALVLADRLRAAVASEPFQMGNCSAQVTISVGVSATALADFTSFEALLDSSDKALYGAKHSGKNCVFTFQSAIVATPESTP